MVIIKEFDPIVNLIDSIHIRVRGYEKELNDIKPLEEKEKLNGIITGLKEAIDIIAQEDRKKAK
ncbi:MAG: hypothetical protein ACOCRL_00360 [Bacillota bacterium]